MLNGESGSKLFGISLTLHMAKLATG